MLVATSRCTDWFGVSGMNSWHCIAWGGFLWDMSACKLLSAAVLMIPSEVELVQ
jgi:hypothetical protein